jgi:hypothetical protein
MTGEPSTAEQIAERVRLPAGHTVKDAHTGRKSLVLLTTGPDGHAHLLCGALKRSSSRGVTVTSFGSSPTLITSTAFHAQLLATVPPAFLRAVTVKDDDTHPLGRMHDALRRLELPEYVTLRTRLQAALHADPGEIPRTVSRLAREQLHARTLARQHGSLWWSGAARAARQLSTHTLKRGLVHLLPLDADLNARPLGRHTPADLPRIARPLRWPDVEARRA